MIKNIREDLGIQEEQEVLKESQDDEETHEPQQESNKDYDIESRTCKECDYVAALEQFT